MPNKITNLAHAREARQILSAPRRHRPSLVALARYILGHTARNPYAEATS